MVLFAKETKRYCGRGKEGFSVSHTYPEVSNFLKVSKPPTFLAMRLNLLNFANKFIQSLVENQYAISPYFSFETKFSMPILYPLNNDILSHNISHFCSILLHLNCCKVGSLLSAISKHLCPSLLFLVLHVVFISYNIK